MSHKYGRSKEKRSRRPETRSGSKKIYGKSRRGRSFSPSSEERTARGLEGSGSKRDRGSRGSGNGPRRGKRDKSEERTRLSGKEKSRLSHRETSSGKAQSQAKSQDQAKAEAQKQNKKRDKIKSQDQKHKPEKPEARVPPPAREKNGKTSSRPRPRKPQTLPAEKSGAASKPAEPGAKDGTRTPGKSPRERSPKFENRDIDLSQFGKKAPSARQIPPGAPEPPEEPAPNPSLFPAFGAEKLRRKSNIKMAFKSAKPARSVFLPARAMAEAESRAPGGPEGRDAPAPAAKAPPGQRREFGEVRERIWSFNERLSRKITEDVVAEMDSGPSSVPMAAKFFENPEEFRYIDIVRGEDECNNLAVLVECLPTSLSLQHIGDFFNSALQQRTGSARQIVKEVLAPPALGGAVLISFFNKADTRAAFELDNTYWGPDRIQVSAAPADLVPEPPAPVEAAAPAPLPSNNWDLKPQSREADWRETRDAIVNSDLPENRNSGYPVVVANIPFKGDVQRVVEKLNLLLDEKFSDEVDYIKEARELSDGTVIVLAKNKSLFNAILGFKERVSIDNRPLTIRPFIDDGSVDIMRLRKIALRSC